MPLLPGKKNIGRNIRELTHHGKRKRSHEQIVAIAEAVADRTSHVGRRTTTKSPKIGYA
jgi:hypothetical protein